MILGYFRYKCRHCGKLFVEAMNKELYDLFDMNIEQALWSVFMSPDVLENKYKTHQCTRGVGIAELVGAMTEEEYEAFQLVTINLDNNLCYCSENNERSYY